ncbi:TIGR03960 family B12-binding radical SAM protein [Dendrosporobacter sp. 1207_IL3150]|uniref:TIGR03960 family B12-binding radical SAM protein n=1 Tax=Dendrosporobacter sp. 1207_IL3150 TaxID=3084054 RepID=UPI002FD912D3
MSWNLKDKLQKTIAQEQGTVIFAPGSRESFALIYPNTYHVGMSNLGMHIIYQKINSRGDTACERVFLPDKKTEQEYIRTNTPLMTLETQRPIYEFSLLGFAVSFEMDYFNILKILSLGKIPLLCSERKENDPIIIAGGPCATFNPEPLADFIDVFIIGEGEEVINQLLDQYYSCQGENLTKDEVLLRLSKVEGVYVPRFYVHSYNEDGTISKIETVNGVPERVNRRWVRDLDSHLANTVIVTSDTEFKEMYLIEVARGCGRHCRFCMAGYCFRRPRVRSLNKILDAVRQAKNLKAKVGLMGAAISDYPYIDELCETIINLGMGLSVASLRADSLTNKLVAALAESGQKTITLAPEAASDRMRKIINKGISDEHIYQSISQAVKAGILNVRLYIMVGLPYEQDSDITEIIHMAENIKKYMEKLGSKGKLTLSINPFIPKPSTPFQWLPMDDMKKVEHKLKIIQTGLKNKKGIEVLVESPKEAYIQGVLSRGDRRLGSVLMQSHKLGGSKHFKKVLKEHNLQEEFYLYRTRTREEKFPWQTMNIGFDDNYLYQELQKAELEKFTDPCVQGCVRCGICKKE